MANYDGRTVSNGIHIKNESDKDAIEKYCNDFYLAMEDCEPLITQRFLPDAGLGRRPNGWEFGIWGYDHLTVLRYVENEDGDVEVDYDSAPCNDEFFEGLKHVIPEGEELVVQGVGSEKLRHVGAWEVKISRDKIEYGGLKFA